MIAYFCVVEDPFVRLDPIVVEHFAREWIVDLGQGRPYRRQVILRQGARVGARIGDGFVLLVERLRNLQCALCRETEAAVRFALQGGKIVQLRGGLSGWPFLFELDNTVFASAFALNGICDLAMPQSRRSAMLIPE